MMQQLIDRVMAADYAVIDGVKKTGPAAAPALDSLASNADPEVRELALVCLNEIGGVLAIGAFTRALLDPEPTVRAAAMRGLHRHISELGDAAPPDLSTRLYNAYDRSDDPVLRQNVALILGKMLTQRSPELERRWLAEADEIAQEGCLVALARLGHPSAQNEYVRRLIGASGPTRVRLLDYGFYVHEPWLLYSLSALLDDDSIAVRIGVDGIRFMPEYLRICDLTVVLIASISSHQFSFPVDRKTNFSDAQLDEVRKWLTRST